MMHKHIFTHFLFSALFISIGLFCREVHAQAPNTWTQLANVGGIGRNGAISFGTGTKGYIGVGNATDLWEYDVAGNTWSQKANFPGTQRYFAASFTIGNTGYVGCGYNDLTGTYYNEFYQYNILTNTWSTAATFPGSARTAVVGMAINGKGYIGGGSNATTLFTDFYEYTPGTNTWVTKGNLPGPGRTHPVNFAIGTKGYFGGGCSQAFSIGTIYSDFYEYDPVTDVWVPKAALGGGARAAGNNFVIGTRGYIGNGFGSGPARINSFYEYNPATNSWAQKANFGGTSRNSGVGFTIGNVGYMGTGYDGTSERVDFWKYTREPLLTQSIIPLSSCPGGTVTIPFDASSATLNSGNVFTAQLSDATGSFASPVVIGTLTGNAATGTITGTIPGGTPAGSGYRIRVVTSSPALTGIDNGVNLSVVLDATFYVDGSVSASGNGLSWTGAFKTLTEALDYANNMPCISQVWVKAGTYYPTTGSAKDSSFRILRNGLKVYGGFAGGELTLNARNVAGNPTILSGDIGAPGDTTDNSYHVVTVVATPSSLIDTSTRIDGFTIRGGNAVGAGNFIVNGISFNQVDGGGIYLAGTGAGNNCSPAIANNIFTRNTAVYGGGLYLGAYGGAGTSSPLISNCTFTDNTATNYGGGLISICENKNSKPTITNSTFSNNKITGIGLGTGGAGIYTRYSVVTVTNCNFTGNRSACGGGIKSDAGKCLVSNSNFNGNITTAVPTGLVNSNALDIYSEGGAAAYIGTADSSYYDNCLISGNTDVNSGNITVSGYGGPDTSRLFLTNSRIIGNTSSDYTGGVGAFFLANVQISKCVFKNNSSNGIGGAAIRTTSATLTVTQSVFDGNNNTGGNAGAIRANASIHTINQSTFSNNTAQTAPATIDLVSGSGSVVQVNNSIIDGSAATHLSAGITLNYSLVRNAAVTAPNLSIDPYFANSSNAIGPDNVWGTADDGLRLTNCSPAINAGSNMLIPAGTATDFAGLTRIQQTTVDMGAYESSVLPLTITKTHTNLLCKGSATGTATVSVTGGSGVYTYSWNTNPVQTTPTATGLAAGVYTVTINDQSGCSVTRTDTITEPATVLSVTVPTRVDVLCRGNSTGTATAAGAGGTPGYTYSWNTTPVQTTATATGLAAGTYTVTVKDANNCTATQNVTINQPAAGLSVSITQTNVACFGAATGSATVVATGGTPGYTYSWAPSGGTGATATGLAAGNYTVTVKDASNCTLQQAVAITGPATGVSVSVSAQTNILCRGASTGSATATGSGGTPGYTYSWNTTPVTATPVASSLAAGTYTVTVRDANNCTATAQAIITEPATSISITTTKTDVTCFGTATGTATAAATGGTGALTYRWNTTPVQTTAAATGLPAGTYTVTVTDANSCTQTQNVTIGQPAAALAATAAAPARVCAGAPLALSATVTGGTTAYTYAWTGPAGFTSTAAAPSFAAARVSMGGVYNLTVTDARGCIATATAITAVDTIAQQPGNISGPAAVCGGSSNNYSITAVATATGYTWTLPATPTGWSGSSTALTLAATAPAAPGTGIISVAAVNGCGTSVARTMNVSVTTAPAQPDPIAGDPAVCGGIAKTYSVTPVAQATAYTWTLPTGWAAPSPATLSQIATSAPLATGTGNGTISVTASNFCGTSAARTLAVTVTNIPAQPAAISGGAAVCGGTAQRYTTNRVAEATAYTWTATGNGWSQAAGGVADTFVNTTAGTAATTVTVTASNQCGTSVARTLAVTVTNKPGNAGTISGPDSVCTGGGAVTFSTGQINEATSYVWTLPPGWSGSSTSQTLSGTPGGSALTGSQTVTVTGSNSCGTGTTAVRTIVVNNPVTPSVTVASSATGAVCAGTAVTYTATGVNGGPSPLYQWKINNVNQGPAGAANTFTTTALNNGDVVSVVLKTSLPCATTAGGQALATAAAQPVSPQVMPGININLNTPPELCRDIPVTFTSNIVAGGASPTYKWWRNGTVIAGASGANYTATGLSNGDTIRVVLGSTAGCRLVDTVSSNRVVLSISPYVTPELRISANPGTVISSGQTVIFTATVTNGGANPEVRWKRNGQRVAGTSGLTWTTSSLRDGDVVEAELVSGARCATPFLVVSKNTLAMKVSTGIGSSAVGAIGSVGIYPNPTGGRFTLAVQGDERGSLGRQVKIVIVNALGQTVYRSAVRPDGAAWSVDVQLDESVANGVYLLRVGEEGAEGAGKAAVIRFEVRR